MCWKFRRFLSVALGLALLGGVWPGQAQAAEQGQPPRTHRIILSLGSDQFIPKAAIEATTDARFQSDLRGLRFLDEVSVIVLADIPFAQLPPALQGNLGQWVELGGSLLVTGGSNSFGLGGYGGTPVGEILPLRPTQGERTGHGFSPTFILDPSHPIFTGVTTTTMANFNETTVASDGKLLLEYRGVSKGGAVGAGLTGSGRPFTTTTATTTQTGGGPAFASPRSAGRPSSVVVLGPGIGSGVAGTPGVGGQGVVPVPNLAPGTSVSSLPTSAGGAPVTTAGGTTITPGSGGYGTSIGQPTPLQPATPTPTTTPGVLRNPVLPAGGTLDAGGIPPGAAIVTQPGPGGTVTITQTTGLPGQNLLQADPGFATEGGIQGGGRAAMPLVAERRQGKGIVLAVALDLNATGEWRDQANFALNILRYLLDQSTLP